MKKYILMLFALLSLATINSCTKEKDKPKPTPDFSFTGGGCSAPCQVLFENKSKDAISYSWNFGDGTNSIETNPTKIYNSGGAYTITLTATGEGGAASISKQVVIGAPKPIVAIYPSTITILLSHNCPQSFTISNVGLQGSIMNYVVADDGALGGFLNIENAIGSLPSGSSASITVSVKPDFVSSQPSLIGATLVLSVHTPQATNFIKFHVSVKIRSEIDVLLGTWSGTWFGNSYGRHNPGQPEPTSPVNGTWTLNLQSVDSVNSTASGTLIWNGVDAYWTYTPNINGFYSNPVPHAFIPDRTIQLNSSNTTLLPPSSASSCGAFRLKIYNNAPGPSNAFYGPSIDVTLNTVSNAVITYGNNGFTSHPYNPSNFDTGFSNGIVTGSKQ